MLQIMTVDNIKSYSVDYVSTGCNRSPHCMAWSHVSGHVYYGSHCSVAVYSVDTCTMVTTLLGHTARVNCVRCIPCPAGGEFIVSGKTIINQLIAYIFCLLHYLIE